MGPQRICDVHGASLRLSGGLLKKIQEGPDTPLLEELATPAGTWRGPALGATCLAVEGSPSPTWRPPVVLPEPWAGHPTHPLGTWASGDLGFTLVASPGDAGSWSWGLKDVGQ